MQLEMNRRELLKRGGQGALLLGGAELLSACGGSSSTPKAAASGGKPVRGGTLTVGILTGGTAETLNPAKIAQYVDVWRGYNLYDSLFFPNQKLQMEGRLAVSAEANATATNWTLHLRDGVTWHDGKPFTADDVVYNFKLWANVADYRNAIVQGVVDFAAVRKTGPLTVEVPLVRPTADLPALLGSFNMLIQQDGSTPASFRTQPIGTGPFKFVSFTPGSSSVFEANPDYWVSGRPYVSRLVVDSTFTDETARLNALLSGAINHLPQIPYIEAKEQASSGNIKVVYATDGVQPYLIDMRVDRAPFDDVRVRQAMKYIPDRQAIIDSAFAGFGSVGNDLFGGIPGGVGAPYYDGTVQHEHDPERAKSLLKAAGREGLTVTLATSNVGAGYVEAATVFAQQAKAAGVNVVVQNVPPSQFFVVAPGEYTYRPFQIDAGFGAGSLGVMYRSYLLSTGPLNVAHWGSPEHDKVIYAAEGALNPATAEELWHIAQMQQFNEGGIMIYANPYYMGASANNVFGLENGQFPGWAMAYDAWIKA